MIHSPEPEDIRRLRRRIPLQSFVADPPWLHNDRANKSGAHWGGAANHYEPMPTREICEMVLPPLDENCWLWLWRLHTHRHDAFQVAEAWGFGTQPVSEVVWVKLTKDGRKIRFGQGHSLRMAHEVCLLFRRGKLKRQSAGVPSVIETDEPDSVIRAPRLEHSRKPDKFYQLVDEFVGDVPRGELFARRHWPNWACYGNQLEPT